MLKWLTGKADYSRRAGEIYGPIVASARQHTFFAAWGVPDTSEGRFEMLALHVALVMLRLGRAGPDGVRLSRAVAETFMTDMDDNMREIGIGDLTVPKKVKRAAAALYDRHRDYAAALAVPAGSETTADAVSQALLPVIGAAFSGAHPTARDMPGLDRLALAHYIERLSGALAVTPDSDCLAGKLPLPWPAH